ncbi:MAG: response regulator [Thermodesulfobacteriota bacterium]|nr:response regulator [Thermodesulfobacteriota bacterium]
MINTEPQDKNKVGGETPHGYETILVVDDDKDVRSSVVQILKRQGYQVLEAASGAEALLICERQEVRIPLLITDVVMPGVSGRDLAQRLLLMHPEMKILFMSVYADDSIVYYGILEERISFIQKPFSIDRLVEKVREILDK